MGCRRLGLPSMDRRTVLFVEGDDATAAATHTGRTAVRVHARVRSRPLSVRTPWHGECGLREALEGLGWGMIDEKVAARVT